MPRSTLIAYCFLFVLGVTLASYLIWSRETWVDGGLAALATVFVMLPLFGEREFRHVRLMLADHRSDLAAQKIAGNEMLRIAREKDREHMQAVVSEYEAMRLHYKPQRDSRGRFVKTSSALRWDDIFHLDQGEADGEHVQPGRSGFAQIEHAPSDVRPAIEHGDNDGEPV